MALVKIKLAAAAAFLALAAAPAMAQSCQEDIAKIAQRRQAAIEVMNRLVKAGHGKLDPIASCPKLRALAAVEGEFVAYMSKNKDWCHVPDEAMANVTAARNKTQSFAAKACNFAAQARRAQQQQRQAAGGPAQEQQQQARPLPTGPL